MVLPSSMRLKGYKCFDYLQKEGLRFHGTSMVLKVVKAKPLLIKSDASNHPSISVRCGVAISKKVSKRAVIRNRIRRILHNHLRLRLEGERMHSNRWLLISLKPCSSRQAPANLLNEFDSLLRDAGFLP